MNVALLKCGQCKKEYSTKYELLADTCGHQKCRECIDGISDASCNQCRVPVAEATQTKPMDEKITLKTKKESKVSSQTHIIEKLSDLGSIQYHCTACGKTFRSRSQKYYHLQCNQVNNALYKCDICQKTFARHSQFKYHSESHASPVNECPKCQKSFSNPLALKKHESLHKVEPKPCPQCDKTFLKKTSLEQHVAAQHLHQLQYGCAYCNKKYASKSTLQLHLQSHEKKRFECPFCGKHFQRNSILNLHLKRHNHTDTYKCKTCDKVFSESGALARHRKIHEDSALQFHCKLCDKNILRKDNMTRHVNTIHPEEKFDDIILIITPLNVNKFISGKLEELPLINDSKNLDGIKQVDFIHSCDKAAETENKAFAKDCANLGESKAVKPQHNIAIIENSILQKQKEMLKIQLSFEHDNLHRTDELSEVNPTATFSRSFINTDFNADVHKPATVTKVEFITSISNIDEKPDDDFSGNKGNFIKTLISNPIMHAGKQVEYNSSSSSKLEQNTAFITSVTKLASENKMLNVHTANKHRNSLFYNLSPTGTNFCETINQEIHNTASVIRSIGNVKKMLTLTPSATAVTKPIVPNKVLLDCEYKHKKYNRHYNVDLYRKILGCDDDNDDDSEDDQHHCNHQRGKHDNPCQAITNSTPVHWRKSFKNSYETSAL